MPIFHHQTGLLKYSIKSYCYKTQLVILNLGGEPIIQSVKRFFP